MDDEYPSPGFDLSGPGAHGKAEALVMEYFRASYRGLVRHAEGYLGNFDGEDVVQEVLIKALDVVGSADPEQLVHHVDKWTSESYVRQVLRNACRDRVRRARRERDKVSEYVAAERLDVLVALQPGGGSSGTVLRAPTPEDHAARLSALARQGAIRAMVQVLYERGSSTRRRQPFLTARHLETVVAQYAPTPAPTDEGALSTEELKNLVTDENDRAKERWDSGKPDKLGKPGRKGLRRRWSDPEAGTQSAAARKLGKSRQAVSATNKEVVAAMQLLHYVAGVLAPEHTLLDPKKITTHVDAYDHLDERAGVRGYAQRLRSAAPAVRTTTGTGTRVQPQELVRPAGVALEQLVSDVHDAEQGLVQITSTPDPSCVLVCDTHTRQRNRVTEIYL